MEKMVYLAAQYLAAAGISFLEHKKDDSHTNLAFSRKTGSLSTQALNKGGVCLSFNYSTFSLEWTGADEQYLLPLDGMTHTAVLQWIASSGKKLGLQASYYYAFHYEFPYPVTDTFTFALLDTERLTQLRNHRMLAQNVLEAVLQEQQLLSEIRIWPHHFDTGAYASLNRDSGIAVGLGLAVPDTLCPDHYFYISGYQEGETINPRHFSPLSSGNWLYTFFQGAILPFSGVTKDMGKTFFNEALAPYKGLLSGS